MSEKRKGLRCHICTGCGLCPGVTSNGAAAGQLHILEEDGLSGRKEPFPGNGRRLAVADIGTTTVAMLLYAPDGSVADRYLAMNPQSAFGADVISRIRAAEREAETLRQMLLKVLEQGLRRFAGKLEDGETLQLVLAGNTTMTYLLMGWDTAELGHAPFCASHLKAEQTSFAGVPCFVFPGMSAFVGGDIMAGVYACKMAEQEEITLLVDLGTNGEMVLGNRHRRIACATAAGPAFEGGANRGVFGADMVSLLAALREEGLLDETGLLAEPYFETGIRIGNVLVTQEAVRSVQLAKGAIAAGIGIMLEEYGIFAAQVDRVILAGGFGYYLKPQAAVTIGLLCEELAERAVSGGNTVLSGALRVGRRLLEGKRFRDLETELSELAEGTEVLNLAEQPLFENCYIRQINLK